MLNFTYRCQRRLVRELRKRAGGRDVALDAWCYRWPPPRKSGRNLALRWAELAPWGGDPQRPSLVPSWATNEEARAVIEAADRICAHEFNLLGSGPVQLGDKIDWHVDFKSGYRWDASVHHARIRWGDLPEGVDIKVPWELSRCMHFASLGLADWITGDARYYHEWKTQLRNWIEANPVAFGVNWACAMDVAMRAVNWLNATIWFRQRIQADEDHKFFAALVESIWHHGLHIERNLEWRGPGDSQAGNHLLADLVGLLAIGAFFGNTRKGARWWRFAKHWIEHEMFHQVNPDGTNFETSTSYHRMVMEMFLWADTLAILRDDPFSESYRLRLGLMAEFVAAYSAPGGVAAQFGDNDSGRLVSAGLDDGQDHRYLTKGQCGFGGGLNRLLLRGNMPIPGSENPDTQTFPDSGLHFMRQGNAWAGLRAGPVSHGGAHAHCDQLSFVLNIAGRDILVDRGTGIYSPNPAKRNRFRSTALHNTAQINGWEQNGFGQQRAEIFQMPDHSQGRILHAQAGVAVAEWEAEHRGFERHRQGLRHSRKVRMTCNRFEIEDFFQALQAGDRLEWHFHFAPGVSCRLDEGQLHLIANDIVVRIRWNFPATADIEQVNHSIAYGVEIPASTLTIITAATDDSANLPYQFQIIWNG